MTLMNHIGSFLICLLVCSLIGIFGLKDGFSVYIVIVTILTLMGFFTFETLYWILRIFFP